MQQLLQRAWVKLAPTHLVPRPKNVGPVTVDTDLRAKCQSAHVAATIEGAYEDIARIRAVGNRPVIGWQGTVAACVS